MDVPEGQVPSPETPVDPAVPAPSTPPVSTPPAPDPIPPATPTEPKAYDEKYVKDLRDEAAGHRTKANEWKTKFEELERAALSEADRIKADLTKATGETIPGLQAENRRLRVEKEAVTLGIVDPEAAVKLVDWSQVATDADVQRELVSLLERKPYLKATPSTTLVPVSTTSPAAPPATEGGPKRYTRTELTKMTPQEAADQIEDIRAARTAGNIDYSR